jgi:hypothetical protein
MESLSLFLVQYSNMNNVGGGCKCNLMKCRLTELEISSCLPSFLDLFSDTVSIIDGEGVGVVVEEEEDRFISFLLSTRLIFVAIF